ncbi:amino acid ABC transporter substrate-binding protein, PAAT family [Burkholderia sp. GAS332]|nr:amino acid ABC transporter substrate-binding protein, PAAT family [Burkholderia sp. GAS332]
MRIRIIVLMFLTYCCVTFAPAAFSQTQTTWDQIMTKKTLRVGCAISEPWCFKDLTNSNAPGAVQSDGAVWRGVAVVLAKRIADAMGVKLEVVETSWGNAVAGLQANQYDVMFMLDSTPERAAAIDFVGPVLWYPVAILVNKDFQPKTWNELNDPNYSFGMPTGSNFVGVIQKNAPKAKLVTLQQSSDVIAAFQSGRISGAVGTAPNMEIARARLNSGKTLVPTPVVGLSTDAGVRKEADARWRNYLQTAVANYYRTGVTQQAYRDYLTYRGINPDTVSSTRREDW